MYGSTNETVHVSTPTFTLLKDACHAVVATYLMLQFERDKKLVSEEGSRGPIVISNCINI